MKTITSHPTIHRWLFGLLAGVCLWPVITPPHALAGGATFALLLGNPAEEFTKLWSKRLLQASVVLLGFSMNFAELLRVGAQGALFAAATIITTVVAGLVIGRRLRLSGNTSALVAVGTAICGGSAIAAVGPVLGASAAEMSVALGTVFSFNAIALYLFPVIGHALDLTGNQFGMWAGVAIHDISSVVGAASVYGEGALPVATAVKLSRTLWIVPLALGAALRYGRRAGGDAAGPARRVPIPWFIGLFALASLLRTFVPGVAAVQPMTSQVSHAGLTVTLFLVGAGLSRRTLRAAGWRSLLLGGSLWLLIGGGSLLFVLANA